MHSERVIACEYAVIDELAEKYDGSTKPAEPRMQCHTMYNICLSEKNRKIIETHSIVSIQSLFS